ncbi:MAG: hypothetical protein LBS19_07815 [Clostridiales bacterium]|jgi:hypothetical protein|nr:hypothetical protein [Clostridiales bacterium]
MSHYTVAVFTTDEDQPIEMLLEPYDENITVTPYVQITKEQMIHREREILREKYSTVYREWKKNPKQFELKHSDRPDFVSSIKSIPKRIQSTDEELYQELIQGMEDRLDENGDLLTTYNPNSKWDWYSVGGRWKGMLIRKGTREKCNAAFVRDIDFESMKQRTADTLKPYEKAMTTSYVKESCMRERFPTEEEYVNRAVSFGTYAVITPNGKWHSVGNMGWWGISSETAEEERLWDLGYYERFIKPALENDWYLTIVDCHI